MAETTTVSVSRSPVSETARHLAKFRDSGETVAETSPLKALARRVLDRDTRRDTSRDTTVSVLPIAGTSSETPVSPVSGVSPVWADDIEERAALVEFGANVPRRWAEGFAALCSMSQPSAFSPERWARIVDAAGVFLDVWAAKAIACGWTDLDVFGCDPDRPVARFDCAGLLLLLDRCEIVGIDEGGADLIASPEARLRYRRRPVPATTISLWQLGQGEKA
jgi:hypothetical protein